MLVVFFRAVILYVLVTLCLRLMGKRQLGELQPAEFVSAAVYRVIQGPELPD